MKNAQNIILAVILSLIAFICLRGCNYVDLLVSEKYETQLEGITKSPTLLQEAILKAIVIDKDKKLYTIQVALSMATIAILLFVYFRLKNRNQSKNTIQ